MAIERSAIDILNLISCNYDKENDILNNDHIVNSNSQSALKEALSESSVPELSTKEKLSLIKVDEPTRCKKQENKLEGSETNLSADIIYNVIWANKSNKKHKTFCDDGILKFIGNVAFLYDMNGTLLGQSKSFKDRNIEYGQVVSICSKDVQVLERSSNSSVIDTSDEKAKSFNIQKTVKTMKKFSSRLMMKEETSTSNQSANDESTELPKKTFKVVWGKITNKKHKTFSDDGYLEVYGLSANLKNDDGTLLGKTNKIDASTIVVGAVMIIGSKEVEIIEELNEIEVQTKENNSATSKLEPLAKRIKKSIQPLPNIASRNLKAKKLPFNFDPLVLPEPDAQHQWIYNTMKRPINQVKVDPCLVKVLRPHQKEGVIFLYRCLMGFFGKHTGAVLADEMGLGKTLQCISIIWTLLKQGPYGSPSIEKVLIVAPSSLCTNWSNEFIRWLGVNKITVFLASSKNRPKDYIKLKNVPVLIISYEMVSRCIDDIMMIPFDLLICDEGHRLKNMNVKISAQLMQITCKRRIIVTGTPIQNDLQEFYSIINFVNPGILGSLADFKSYYLQPIVQSHQLDCEESEKNLGDSRVKELYNQTSHFILRRTQEIINQYLPKKQEIILFCKITDTQRQIYQAALDYYEKQKYTDNKDVVHLQLINCLKKICNHPILLSQDAAKDEANIGELNKYLLETITNRNLEISDSGKVKIILNLLKEVYDKKEKIVVVSYFIQTLNMLANLCKSKGYIYARLDGATPNADRQQIIDEFNSLQSKKFVFLLSAKAGGVGLNITGASRLILFDTDWNPATDIQAMSRIWRDGQTKSVYIYRLITTGTIEEKMLQRQISKTSLSGAVVDIQDNSLKLSNNDLKLIFNLTEAKCTTHDVLQCSCQCNGVIPLPLSEINNSHEVDNRPCQLSLKSYDNVAKKSLQMHELFQWEHHGFPVAQKILTELGLAESSGDILFMFRNETTT